MAGFGRWSLDVANERLACSRAAREVLGAPTAELETTDALLDLVLPAHRADLAAAIERCTRTGTAFDLEVNLQPAAGRDGWVRLIGEACTGADGGVAGIDGVMLDVSDQLRERQELQRMAAELSEANQKLTEASRFKDDLLSIASHELRTPLTPVLGFLEVLETRGNLTDEQQQLLKIVSSNARRMLRLVDDLLVIRRASSGVLTGQPQAVNVEATVRDVLNELGDVVGPVELAVTGVRAVADPQHLEQIIINLLTNASKYGEPPLTVTAAPAGDDRIAIEVADQGSGVPAAFRAHMWERFAQHRDDGNAASGVGLGLPIIRLLAEANDGTASYRDGVPTGAVFTVELPGSCDPRHLPPADPGRGGTAVADGQAGGRAPAASPRSDAARSVPQPQQQAQQERAAATVTEEVTHPAPPATGRREADAQADPEEVVAWATRQLLHVESRDEAAAVVLRVIQRLGGWTIPARLADQDALPLDVSFGRSEPLLAAAQPQSIGRMHLERHLPAVVEDARRAIGMIGSVTRLRDAASVDPLTGLANRRRIDRLLARGCSGAAIVMIDLDGFKQVNDEHGHGAGDRILRDFSGCLRAELRAGDHAGRLGGDEFVAVLWDTDEAGARRYVERLRQTWEEMDTDDVGCSAGIAIGHDDEPATDVLERADAAMYIDKATRRSGGEGG